MSRILLALSILVLAIAIILAALLYGDTDVEIPVLSDLLATSTPQAVIAESSETPISNTPAATLVVSATAEPTEVLVANTPAATPVVLATVGATEVPATTKPVPTATPVVLATVEPTEVLVANTPAATPVVLATVGATEVPATTKPVPTATPVVLATVEPTEVPPTSEPVPTATLPPTALPPTAIPSTGTITGIMSEPQQITNVTSGAFDPTWNPTGNNIAYLEWKSEGACANRCADIGLVNPDGTGQRVLATGPGPAVDVGIGSFISWLGETNLLLTNERNHYHEYMTIDSTQAPFNRTVLNGDDEAFTRIMFVPGGMGGYGIASSRDGKTILWRHQQGSYVSIRIAPYDVLLGQNSNAVGTVLLGDETSSAAYAGGIALSPDGTSFAVAINSDTADGVDLYIVDTSGLGVLRRLTTSGDEGVLNRGPNFSPDGRFVAFHRLVDGQYDLSVYDLQTDQEIRLTDTAESSEANPSWSPDGTHLAYQYGAEGIPTNIFVAEITTSVTGP